MLNNDQKCLSSILESIDKIELFTQDHANAESLNKDVESFDATMMNFINIGEMASKLSSGFTEKHHQVDWLNIVGLRNIIAHDYFGIDFYETWEIIHKDLPELKSFIRSILNLTPEK